MDRQDIDALLVGALYGELTPADEARLTTHLESHPQDRGALDDLKSARAKVRESRIFELQAEPPQHISALLLQEAHRRAPKKAMAADTGEKDSWFWRFARSFMLHPAMAAAAMLIVVLGVGAIIYNNKGADFAKREAPASSTSDNQGQAAPTLAQDTMVAAGSAAPLESYNAGLAESEDIAGADRDLAEGAAGAKKQDESATARWRSDSNADPAPVAKNKGKGIAVTTEQMQPKDFEADRAEERTAVALESKLAKESNERQKAAAPAKAGGGEKSDTALLYDVLDGADDGYAGRAGGGGTANGIVAGGAPGAAAPAPTTATAPKGNVAAGPATATTTTPSAPAIRPYAQPPPPPSAPATDKVAATPKPEPAKPTITAATKQEAKPDSKTATGSTAGSTTTDTKKVATQKPAEKAPAQTASPPPDPQLAWAKGQHASAVKLAKDGKCTAAAQVALAVSQKMPSYYASAMATDRQLKACKQYIDDARDREAEKSAKSRAQKRVNADEPARAPAESAK